MILEFAQGKLHVPMGRGFIMRLGDHLMSEWL
jgi:hypothetical protein